MTTDLSPAGLALMIKDEFRLAQTTATSTFIHLIRAGEHLTQAKAKIPHGGWEQWVLGNLPFGVRQAQRYMRLYEHRDAVEAKATCETLLGMNGALALIADERPERPEQEEHVHVEQADLADPTPAPPRSPASVEVIPPRSTEPTEPAPTRPADVSDAEPAAPRNSKEAYPACAKYPEIRGWLFRLRRELDTRENRGWRTREQGEEVITELRRLLAQAERIGGADSSKAG